jgi:hypothetical protein
MNPSAPDDLLPVVADNLITPSATPVPPAISRPPVRKGILWKWSLGITAVLLSYLMWQCGSALGEGRKLADTGVRHFHQQLNAEQYEEICRDADDAFTGSQPANDMIKILRAVHKKLGIAEAESQVNIRVDANTNGTFITTWYNTKYSSGLATETFAWRKKNGSLTLVGYNVQSAALLN